MSGDGRTRRSRAAPRWAVWLVAASALPAATTSRACGVCDQDKVAATYDHAVVTTAASEHHRMLFAAIIGPVAVGDVGLAGRLTRTLERAAGVDAGTARVSLSPAAVSLVWDPSRTTRARLLAALTRRLERHGLSLRPIEAALPSGTVAPERASSR